VHRLGSSCHPPRRLRARLFASSHIAPRAQDGGMHIQPHGATLHQKRWETARRRVFRLSRRVADPRRLNRPASCRRRTFRTPGRPQRRHRLAVRDLWGSASPATTSRRHAHPRRLPARLARRLTALGRPRVPRARAPTAPMAVAVAMGTAAAAAEVVPDGVARAIQAAAAVAARHSYSVPSTNRRTRRPLRLLPRPYHRRVRQNRIRPPHCHTPPRAEPRSRSEGAPHPYPQTCWASPQRGCPCVRARRRRPRMLPSTPLVMLWVVSACKLRLGAAHAGHADT